MLTQVVVKNFKSFRDARIPLGRLTIVLGSNGAGKSNLFDALRFLRFVGMGTSIRDAIEGHASATQLELVVSGIRGGARAITHMGSDSNVFTVGVEINDERTKDRISYVLSVDAISYKVMSEELVSQKHPGQYVFSTHPDPNPLVQDLDAPVIQARFYKNTRGPNPKRDFSAYETILSQFKGRRSESILNEEVADLVRNELAAIRPLELRPEVLRQYSPLGRSELGEHGENLAAVAWLLETRATSSDEDMRGDAPARLEAIRSWLSELAPHPIERITVQLSPTSDAILALKEEPFPEPLTARSLSDGTLRFAALTFAVFGTEGRQTLVVEELENGIHPARLALLVRMLETAVSQDVRVQVIASSHAPGVLQYASEEVARRCVVIGWDAEEEASRAIVLGDLPEFDRTLAEFGLGELQAEGWFQAAADR